MTPSIAGPGGQPAARRRGIGRRATPEYLTAPLTRGAIVRTVIATGSVNPVVTVQVGAFVSGTIQKRYCDSNTRLKANQLCAKIDPRPYQVVVDQNAAALGSARPAGEGPGQSHLR